MQVSQSEGANHLDLYAK